jgi:poly(hydroxyalkanoate) granule-associated protein
VAKLKKSVRSKPASRANNSADLQARAEHLSRSLVESAQQIWMAGVGAFTRAQGEGSKLFEALVKEGMNIEKSTRKLASGKIDTLRDAMEGSVGVARGRASDTWDRLEKVFEDRVQRALNRLGVPGRDDLAELTARVDALSAKAGVGARRVPVSRKPAKSSRAAKSPVRSPAKAVRSPAAKSAAKSSSGAARKTLPKARRPASPQA